MHDRTDFDDSLAARIRNGDDAALTELMDRYKRPILNFVYRLLSNASEADDVAQEVFVRVYQNIRKFRLLDKKLYTEDGEVTPTMKVKRKAIAEQYKDIIEEMYKGGE